MTLSLCLSLKSLSLSLSFSLSLSLSFFQIGFLLFLAGGGRPLFDFDPQPARPVLTTGQALGNHR